MLRRPFPIFYKHCRYFIIVAELTNWRRYAIVPRFPTIDPAPRPPSQPGGRVAVFIMKPTPVQQWATGYRKRKEPRRQAIFCQFLLFKSLTTGTICSQRFKSLTTGTISSQEVQVLTTYSVHICILCSQRFKSHRYQTLYITVLSLCEPRINEVYEVLKCLYVNLSFPSG